LKYQFNFVNNYLGSRFIRFTKSLMQSKFLRLLITLFAIIFCIVYLNKNAQDLKSVQIELKLDWLYLFLSFVIMSLIVWTGGLAWILILKGLGQKINILEGLRIQNFSNISKYVPGFIWPYATKIYLCKEVGITQSVAGLSVLLEFSLLILAGFFISLFFLPEEFINKIIPMTGNIFLFRVLVGGGLFLFFGAVLFSLRLIQRRFSISFSIKSLFLLAASLLFLMNWLGLGIGIWILSKSIYLLTPARIEYFVFSFVVSVISGILFLPVPNGIGVRESIMVFFLSKQIMSSVAVLIAILSRMLITLGEVVNFVGILLIQKIINQRKR